MTTLFATRLSLVWLLLVTGTIASWLIDRELGSSGSTLAGTSIIVIAFIKVRFVMVEFMETRVAPLSLRVAGEAWCILMCVVLIFLLLRAA